MNPSGLQIQMNFEINRYILVENTEKQVRFLEAQQSENNYKVINLMAMRKKKSAVCLLKKKNIYQLICLMY